MEDQEVLELPDKMAILVRVVLLAFQDFLGALDNLEFQDHEVYLDYLDQVDSQVHLERRVFLVLMAGEDCQAQVDPVDLMVFLFTCILKSHLS